MAAVRDERGAGVVSTVFGFAIFLFFLLFATQVVVALYARSWATAESFDQARRLAAAGDRCGTEQRTASDAISRSLGRRWHEVHVDTRCGPASVVVTVDADGATSLVPAAVRRPMGLDGFHRRFSVRVEERR